MPAGNSTQQADAPLHAHSAVRLKLVMPGQDKVDSDQQRPQQPATTVQPQSSASHGSSGSPERPSYSPVTPTLSQTSLPGQDDGRVGLPPPTQWMEEPEPLPVSLDDNPDAIALRAALSILQIQRQQALRDMRDLDKMKEAALSDPEQFVKDLEQGKLSRPPRLRNEGNDEEPSEPPASDQDLSKFGKFPTAQDIVRSPPVEWAKYHIVGEPLDRLHEVQQHYPGFTENMHNSSNSPQPHEIAAPYRPFQDRLDNSQSDSKSHPRGP